MSTIKIKKHITLNLEVCTSHDISYPEWILCEQVQFLSVRKGYCYAKRKTLAEALKISVRGLQKMIDRLAEKGLLEKLENTALVVTEKWLEFQEIKDASHEQSSPKVRTKFTPSHEQSSPPTIKRDNLKVDIKNVTTVTCYSDEIPREIAGYLADKIISNKPNFQVKNFEAWVRDIDRAMRIDKRTKEELIGCIDWIYTHGDFWIPNILSGKKLREKFDTMEAQMMKSGNKNYKIMENLKMMERIRNGEE